MIAKHALGWKSGVSEEHWRTSVETHCARLLDRPIATITLQDILAALKPVYDKAPNYAALTRRRVEEIFAYALAYGLLPSDRPNPADHNTLEHLFPKKPQAVHRPALPYEEVPALVTELRAIPLSASRAATARALEFTILTALRVSESCGARWEEIDLGNKLMTIPAARMKGGRRPHEVPLSPRAVAIVREMEQVREAGDLVFPSARRRAGAVDGEQALARISQTG